MSKAQQSQLPEDDILNPKVNVSCLDFLLIELVPLAQRITDQLHAREQALIDEFRRSKIFNGDGTAEPTSTRDSSAPAVTDTATESKAQAAGSVTGTVGGDVTSPGSTAAAGGYMDDATKEAVFWRLDGLGYRVGQGLAERFSAGKPRPTTPLDAIKFVCKDLWTLLFRKQIDNLKTNHRGVFVLTDARFQPLSRMSVDRRAGPKAAEDALRKAQAYLYFPCGVIRGVLQSLGIDAAVSAETTEIPSATFQIKTKGTKA